MAQSPSTDSCNIQGPVIVAMAFMGMVQVTIDEVIDMIAMRNGFVTAVRAVYVRRTMTTTLVTIGAGRWILFCNVNAVLDNPAVRLLMFEMAIMEIIDMITMQNRRMPTSVPMDMFGMVVFIEHKFYFFNVLFDKKNETLRTTMNGSPWTIFQIL